MKQIEDKITQVEGQRADTEARIEELNAEIDALVQADEAKAVEDMITAKEHAPCSKLQEAHLQIEAATYRLKITGQALAKLEHDRQAAQDKIHLREVSAITKQADAVLDDYQAAVDSMFTVVQSLKKVQEAHHALNRDMSLNRGRQTYEVNDDCAVPSLALLTNLTDDLSLMHANRSHAIVNGCPVVGGKIVR